ncbi:MAG TPA: zinc ABC transporter substrate-binding protein [Acidimicrobiia bacterium]|nr:zinc ABC transporter substrate-binding protein [Acidimicrobiia bacterium]
MLRIILSLTLVASLSGCAARTWPADGRRRVVASFFPLAEAARLVGGGAVDVRDLTPSGAEPHDLELTPADIDAIETADLVIVVGHGFQPAVEAAAQRHRAKELVVLDALGITGDAASDPHVWLDPVLMHRAADAIATRLGRPDVLATSLADLDTSYRQGLSHCARTTIVTAHEAFGWMARRYGLQQDALAGIDPETEPGADRIAQLADLVQREHVTTIFTESLASPRVADALAREAGVTTAVFDPIESADAKLGTYDARMRRDLRTLEQALGCT